MMLKNVLSYVHKLQIGTCSYTIYKANERASFFFVDSAHTRPGNLCRLAAGYAPKNILISPTEYPFSTLTT